MDSAKRGEGFIPDENWKPSFVQLAIQHGAAMLEASILAAVEDGKITEGYEDGEVWMMRVSLQRLTDEEIDKLDEYQKKQEEEARENESRILVP